MLTEKDIGQEVIVDETRRGQLCEIKCNLERGFGESEMVTVKFGNQYDQVSIERVRLATTDDVIHKNPFKYGDRVMVHGKRVLFDHYDPEAPEQWAWVRHFEDAESVRVPLLNVRDQNIKNCTFKNGDRVQVQVDGDNYLMGTFASYHEKDPRLVWVAMDDRHDPLMQTAWQISRVSLGEREVSPDSPTHLIGGNDTINHPAHYTMGKIEVIDFIEDKGLGFHLGNVVKYVARAEHKGKALEDLKKARWYLNREIERRENETS